MARIRLVHVPGTVRTAIRTMIRTTSVAQAARDLGLAEATVGKLAGGLDVTQGILLVAERALAARAQPQPDTQAA